MKNLKYLFLIFAMHIESFNCDKFNFMSAIGLYREIIPNKFLNFVSRMKEIRRII